MYRNLVKTINNKCLTIGGYDIFAMRDIITNFCNKNDILPDTSTWTYLVDYLWCNLSVEINNDFDDENEFESWIIYEMV